MRRVFAALVLSLLACQPARVGPPVAEPTSVVAPSHDAWAGQSVDASRLKAHLEFLADDAREGRAPGSAGDVASQEYITAVWRELGLQPAVGDTYCQRFTVTDGVRLRAGQALTVKFGKASVAAELVPFAHETAAAVDAPLVYLGHGLELDDPAVVNKIRGAIVVVRAGAGADPHLDVSRTRAQSKLIAVRDRGAVGFVLWDPDSDLPFPNHGEANDLQLPAVALGSAGTPAVMTAFATKLQKDDVHRGLKVGATARAKASLHTPVERVTAETCNLAAVLPGHGSQRLVVGAHVDHLGFGTISSLAQGAREIHNGADDNASGVAAMMALAAALAEVPVAARPYAVEFVAFGAEEMGLLGSKHYVAALTPEARARLVAMINFDMVGRMQEQRVVVAGVGTSSVWEPLLAQVAAPLEVRPSEDGFGASDQASFYAAGLPVLHFFSGTHTDYHKPSDDIDKINFAGAAEITDLALRVVAGLMRDQPKLDYIKVAAPAARVTGFRVSLGTVPDYAAKVEGVALADVRAGGPAAVAGVQAGDIIIKIGERDIKNFDDYMATFGELTPGVVTTVRVRRGDQTLDLPLTPAAPQRR